MRRMPKNNEDVDRGEWLLGELYFAGDLNPETKLKEQSHVWYFGCKFKNLVTGTLSPPLWNSTDWLFEEGNPSLELKWIGSEDSVFIDDPEITLAVSASLYNQDVTEEPSLQWDWKRESFFDDTQDVASDSLWNSAHENIGTNELHLELADMNYRFGKHPDNLIFTVTATLILNNGMKIQRKMQVFI